MGAVRGWDWAVTAMGQVGLVLSAASVILLALGPGVKVRLQPAAWNESWSRALRPVAAPVPGGPLVEWRGSLWLGLWGHGLAEQQTAWLWLCLAAGLCDLLCQVLRSVAAQRWLWPVGCLMSAGCAVGGLAFGVGLGAGFLASGAAATAASLLWLLEGALELGLAETEDESGTQVSSAGPPKEEGPTLTRETSRGGPAAEREDTLAVTADTARAPTPAALPAPPAPQPPAAPQPPPPRTPEQPAGGAAAEQGGAAEATGDDLAQWDKFGCTVSRLASIFPGKSVVPSLASASPANKAKLQPTRNRSKQIDLDPVSLGPSIAAPDGNVNAASVTEETQP